MLWDLHLLSVRCCQCWWQYRLQEECDKLDEKHHPWQLTLADHRPIKNQHAAFTWISLALHRQQDGPRPRWRTGSGRTSCSVRSHSQRWHLFSCTCCISAEANVLVFFIWTCAEWRHWVEASLRFTSLLPRFTSFFTSSTEKPNRSSYSGEFWQ